MNTRRSSGRTCRACAAGAYPRGVLFQNWQSTGSGLPRPPGPSAQASGPLGREDQAGGGPCRRQRWGPASRRSHLGDVYPHLGTGFAAIA